MKLKHNGKVLAFCRRCILFPCLFNVFSLCLVLGIGLYLVPRSRMSGAIPLLPVYAFILLEGSTLFFNLRIMYVRPVPVAVRSKG